jgi:GNAT superfamily N-acetyltransferase
MKPDEVKEKLDVVVCRPALPLDTEDVLSFTSRIWEGTDYVPAAWQEWLTDTKGLCAVAEYHGHAIGLVKLSWVAPGQWWVMGLRVDPDHQSLGVASRLHHYILEQWEHNLGGVVRLSTRSTNLPIHHLAERTGFRRILDLSNFIAKSELRDERSFRAVRADELTEACDFACDADSNLLMLGLIDLCWEWAAIDKTILSAAIGEQRLWWWRKKRGLIMTVEDDTDDILCPLLQYAGCEMEDLSQLLVDFRAFSGKRGYGHARWVAPLIPQAIAPLERAGYTRNWENSWYIYEKYAPKK